jgi:2-polyprenyl-3-methyl-5-hydroxy-6-metoxy-1,4-benzoquinol methylase
MTEVNFKDEFYARYRSTHTAHRKGPATLENFRRSFPNFKKKYGRLLPANRDAKIVELGCGDGRFVYWLNELGYSRVNGSDLSAEQVDVARGLGIQNIEVANMFEALNSAESEFDVLFLRDVVEHFDRNAAFQILKLCHRSLKPGGRLVLHLPNADSPFFGRIRYGDFTHEMAYSMNSLTQLFNVLGFVRPQFVSDEMACPNLRAVPRFVCWKCTEAVYKFFLASEIGFGRKIVTQNLIASADRPVAAA